MNSRQLARVAQLLQESGIDVPLPGRSQACSGGCINEAHIVQFGDVRVFVKSNRDASDMFLQESICLRAMAERNVVRVPQVIAQGKLDKATDCLILEVVDSGRAGPQFGENFGRRMAELHRSTESRFGWSDDNYIGATPQPNAWSDCWIEFFAERRLRHQLRLATDRGFADSKLKHGVESVIQRLGEILLDGVQPALLHGDLWSGNYMVDSNGEPVLIDPACYFGDREMEFALPMMFGGFDARFYTAYNDAFPLEDGWQERVELYTLYHQLNHLNLFGASYYASSLRIAQRFGG